ncbi:unnamed protein product [Protopolystoma xenopodis]|uniref:Uncharacterized protein n=1 Tax=Protopolystoma xenopodis TaxID=117903 RepID=A0A3S5BBK7_9PLAT|nr:unnamed protein product [Protopolystoma xenopodis]
MSFSPHSLRPQWTATDSFDSRFVPASSNCLTTVCSPRNLTTTCQACKYGISDRQTPELWSLSSQPRNEWKNNKLRSVVQGSDRNCLQERASAGPNSYIDGLTSDHKEFNFALPDPTSSSLLNSMKSFAKARLAAPALP